jgi:hypothetical protein
MAGIFQKVKTFLIGTNPIEAYGGNKGGYSYIIFYDPSSRQILHQFITPPKQQSKNIGVDIAAAGQGLTGSVNYQSEESFGETFAVSNESANLKLPAEDLITKYNENQRQKLTKPETTYAQTGDKNILVGGYLVPVTSNNVECPNLVAHFPIEDQRIDYLLGIYPEFIIKTFYPQEEVFRSAIFLHDGIKKELKMRAAYNMTGDVDYMFTLPDTAGAVGAAYSNRTINIWDSSIISHEDRGVNHTTVWADMNSILAIPILDKNNIPLGAISIDTNKSYVEARFKNATLNNSLVILARSLSRFLERV